MNQREAKKHAYLILAQQANALAEQVQTHPTLDDADRKRMRIAFTDAADTFKVRAEGWAKGRPAARPKKEIPGQLSIEDVA